MAAGSNTAFTVLDSYRATPVWRYSVRAMPPHASLGETPAHDHGEAPRSPRRRHHRRKSLRTRLFGKPVVRKARDVIATAFLGVIVMLSCVYFARGCAEYRLPQVDQR
jgi:hypothetical protein